MAGYKVEKKKFMTIVIVALSARAYILYPVVLSVTLTRVGNAIIREKKEHTNEYKKRVVSDVALLCFVLSASFLLNMY